MKEITELRRFYYYSSFRIIVPQIETIKTISRLSSAIYSCGGFDTKLLSEGTGNRE
jgi:hypothetical protein